MDCCLALGRSAASFVVQLADFSVYVDNSGLLPPIEPPRPQMKDGATDTSDTPAKPPDPYFIVPPGFRKNNYFVGMEKEYKELDRRLFDKRVRKDGTACVLLHGQAGAGKSHLARQYVNNNKTKFSGGIFWISVKSIEESRQAFWNIFQKVIPRDSPSFRDGTDPSDFVQLVKKWFEERHDWLIVFDGVAIDTDRDVTELTQFVPDSKDSSIIYVSRAKNLESKQRLLRPHPIKVGPLKEEEAQKLLFKELHIKKPSEGEKRKAAELVKKIGGLPLAIDAISHRLADTHEPLTKYKLSYADPTLENTYSTILNDLLRLGHIEAWNLINVLCWFAQDLPVEMVHLGLKVLRPNVEVRATEVGGKPDINTTFSVLMRYALIERNEPDDRDSTSSSRDSLVEPEPIDMLKIHNVVQNFICDTLNARGLLPQWLEYAVKLFSYSYWQANSKIRQKPEQGRVSDYRYYKVHGQRLWDHTLAYGSRLQPLDGIRAALKPVMDSIDEEIRQRQPNSSQESLKEGVFQISIFDRTSSSSENSIPGPTTPNHRPTPPPLASENEYGFPKAKPPIDSPGSLSTPTPRRQVHIVDSDHHDAGYDADQEGHPTSHLMEQTLSDITARPHPRSRAQTGESNHEGWQVVSTRKPRKLRRDLGSFRPSPAGTRIHKENIPRSDPNKRPHRRESSPALKSLQKVQAQSPPPSRNGAASPSQPSNGLPVTTVAQPTWAGIAAGNVGQTAQQGSSQQFGPQTGIQATPKLMDRGRPRDSPKNNQGNAQGSPLASEFLPDQVPAGNKGLGNNSPPSTYSVSPPPTGFRYSTPYPGSSRSLNQIAQARPVDMTIPPYSIQPPVSGPNPAPLPIAEGITITSKRPLPADFHENSQTAGYPTPASNYTSSQGQISPYQPVYDTPYPPTIMPAGYYSQPVSRNASHQSYGSVAETDPIRYPSAASPLLPPISDSPRDRYPDGQSFRKSPKTSFIYPAYPPPTSSRVSPHDLSHTGGWTQQSPPPPAPYDMTMSRSSSGPGVAVEGTTSTGIVPFENYPGSSVQFGEHPPVSVQEARLRTLRARELQREQEVLRELNEQRDWQERAERRESAPYPDINLIPTGSDRMELEGMVRGVSGLRPRGASAPEMEDPVGLGLRMG